jgi:hypothetical protein
MPQRQEPDHHDRAEGTATLAVPLLWTANRQIRMTIVSGTTYVLERRRHQLQTFDSPTAPRSPA